MTSKASIHNINHLRFKLRLGEDEKMNIPISAKFLLHLNSRVNERTIGITYKQVKFNDNQYQMQDKNVWGVKLTLRQEQLANFQKYIINSAENHSELFRCIKESKTSNILRFNVWRLLLQILPISGNWNDKVEAIESSRKRWVKLSEEAKGSFKSPLMKESSPPIAKNPLMKVAVKVQKKEVETDAFLRQQIKKDVDRTYQQMDLFQNNNTLKILSSVLFVWCKANPQISYKQGMNEVLASILYVYFEGALSPDHTSNNPLQDQLFLLNNVTHAQADLFAVFQKIMQIQKKMYKQNLDDKVKGFVNPNSKNNSPILQRIIQIQDQRLKALDLQIFRTLKLQDVKTKTFLLRWIRCMHTRQFGLFHSLPIWDCIFLESYQSPISRQKGQFQFIDAMCLAMFIYMRSLVLTRETANQILHIYQKYPQLQGQDLVALIQLAWSVIDELRALSANSAKVTNWYQESGKSKGIGLMDTNKQSQYKNKQQQQAISQKQNFNTYQQPNLYPQIDNKSPETRKQQPNPYPSISLIAQKQVHIGNSPVVKQEKSSPLSKSQKVTQKEEISKSPIHIQPIKQIPKQEIIPIKKRQIFFQADQLKEIAEKLRKSISLNDDIESRGLANQVLGIIEGHLKK